MIANQIFVGVTNWITTYGLWWKRYKTCRTYHSVPTEPSVEGGRPDLAGSEFPDMASIFRSLLLACAWTIAVRPVVGAGYYYSSPTSFKPSPWYGAHATFYGDDTASETMGTLSIDITKVHVYHFTPPFSVRD